MNAAELHAGGSCGFLGWQLLGAGSKKLVEVGDLFMQEKKKDETGHASLTRVAVSSFKRVGLCCEQTFHKESVLSLGNTANATLCHPH